MALSASGMSIGRRFATLSLFNLTSGPLQELFGQLEEVVRFPVFPLSHLSRDAGPGTEIVISILAEIVSVGQRFAEPPVDLSRLNEYLTELHLHTVMTLNFQPHAQYNRRRSVELAVVR